MIDELRECVEGAIAGAVVEVAGEGNRFELRVVADAFEGLGRVKRQQAVYAAIREHIQSGAVHAVTIRALTPAEAE
ncbi:MAG: BolA/IbaG family iron-sulfur metabolism protein [Gammaproteobacteria bacterium]|nr:BolA/IbaG family iron-sulfur metabolism protein [Gammaproteobacteria bacterium]